MNKFHALLAAALVVSAPAFANEKKVTVPYQDLSLTSVEGRKVLDNRLQNAAAEVCAIEGFRSLGRARVSRDCRDAALADARNKAQVVTARANRDTELASR